MGKDVIEKHFEVSYEIMSSKFSDVLPYIEELYNHAG